MTASTSGRRLCSFQHRLTKNPSVPVRRGVISSPHPTGMRAARKSSALSHSTDAVCAGGVTVNLDGGR